MRPADLPILALSVSRQNERALPRADQYSYFAHNLDLVNQAYFLSYASFKCLMSILSICNIACITLFDFSLRFFTVFVFQPLQLVVRPQKWRDFLHTGFSPFPKVNRT